MKILFIHQNFPAQFRNLAKHLVTTGKHELLALKQPPNVKFEGVGLAAYKFLRNPEANTHPLLKEMEAKVLRGEAVADAARRLKAKGYTPDVIVAHPNWGEVLFIKDIWPKIKLICHLVGDQPASATSSACCRMVFFIRKRANPVNVDS